MRNGSLSPAYRRTAIVADGQTYTYAQLDDAARLVAAGLLNGRDDLREARIAFRVRPGFGYAAVQRGIWLAGGIAVPVAMSHPDAEVQRLLEDAEAERFVTDADVMALLASPPADRLPELHQSRRALIVYTSGTTGRPKGAVTTHEQMDAQVAALVEAWGWTAADRLLLVLPLHHVHGIINGLGCALSAEATCEIVAEFDAEHVWARLASGDITVFTAVPTIYHRLIASWDAATPEVRRARSDGARTLRLMMSGSAALPVQLLERYGMTELGMALSNPLDGERRPGFVGTPLPRVEVRIVDEAAQPVAAGTPGELEVRGPAVFKEYWRRPADTAAAFRDGWFRTGDVALVQDGSYRLLGRTSVDIIKTGGYKVSALEIEETLRQHPAIAECAVIGLPDQEWGERVAAAIELARGCEVSLPELQAWARAQLAPYKIPRALRTVDALPRNAMGKVVKPDVAKLFA